MARRSTVGSIDDLGHLITAAFGLDREWTDRAKCSSDKSNKKGIPSPWQFDPNQKVEFINADGDLTIIKGREMIDAALMVCHGCPAQYDCAAYAVEGEVLAGTWAMRIFDLAWLRKQPNWRDLIADARRRQEPLQKYVPKKRMQAEAEQMFVGIRRDATRITSRRIMSA